MANRTEPGLAARATEAIGGIIPALMDYEAELALAVLAPVTREGLRRGELPRLGYFLAGDLTARAIQILGEGRTDRMRYWGAAKSFPGFLPCSTHMFVPTTPLRRWPSLELVTEVNGVVRQRARTDDLVLHPLEALRTAAEGIGTDLAAGDVVLTGTPAGVALATPRWKKAIADRVLDRFGKLSAVIDGYARHDRFLRPGDDVVFRAGELGRVAVRVEV